MRREWIEPKTDWVAEDFINFGDYNRIRNNLLCLNDKCNEHFPPEVKLDLGGEKALGDYAYASEYNALENALESINRRAHRYDIGVTQEFTMLGVTIDYEELNRLEKGCLRLYQMFEQIENGRRTAFRANGTDFVDSGEVVE